MLRFVDYIQAVKQANIVTGASKWVWPRGHGCTNILTKRGVSIISTFYLISWSSNLGG